MPARLFSRKGGRAFFYFEGSSFPRTDWKIRHVKEKNVVCVQTAQGKWKKRCDLVRFSS